MNLEYFIARRITFQSKRSFSKLVVRLAISAIALSLAVMLISVAVIKGFQGEIKHKITGFGSHIQIAKFRLNQSFENDPITLSQAKLDSIRNISHVKHVQAYANKPGILKAGDNIEGVVLKGVDSNFNWEFFQDHLIKGNPINWTDSQPSNQIIVSKDLADKLLLDTGDQVVVYFVQKPTRARNFTISGIYNTGLEEVDQIFILSDIRHIRKLNGWDSGQVGGYEVLLEDLDQVQEVIPKINSIIPGYYQAKSIREIFPQIFDWLGLLNFNVEIILILMAMVASINMITALLIMILERTQMIGTLKAMGASNFSVMKVFIYNAAFLIGFGIVLGNALGLGLIFLQDTFDIVKLAETSYYLQVVPVYYNWGLFMTINLASFLFCSIMMILPSILITTIVPVKALRFD